MNEERKARMDWRIRVVREAEEEWKKRKIEIEKRMERIFPLERKINRKNKNEEKVEKLTNRKEEDV